jgi:ubiquinone/menaquinone biosynthesis C-methylase UbiE
VSTRDLLHQEETRTLVREAYRVASPTGGAVAELLYTAEELAGVPRLARDHALGVANHLSYAGLAPGETVLDLGCGGGIDVVLAAQRVGPAGRVFGLDFLPEMLELTRASVEEAGLENVETVEAEMEDVPLADGSVDVVISNGTLNLSPRKARVLAECARVLAPDGRLCVSDLTLREEELPPEILTHPASWAG